MLSQTKINVPLEERGGEGKEAGGGGSTILFVGFVCSADTHGVPSQGAGGCEEQGTTEGMEGGRRVANIN